VTNARTEAPALPGAPPPLPAAAVPAPLPLASALRRFGLEVLIMGALFALLSLVGAVAWGFWRGLMLAIHGTAPADAAAMMQAIGRPGPLAVMAMSVLSVGGTALLAMAWRAPARKGERQAAAAALRRVPTWLLVLFTAAATITCSIVGAQLAAAFQETLQPSNLELVRGTVGRHPLLLVLFAVVLAPLYEEVLFRRVLFRRLWRDGWPRLGMVLSGVLFALMHEPPILGGKPLIAAAPLWLVYTGMGIAFAWVYRRTGSLWAAVLAHALNNAFAIGMLLLFGIDA
jgi:membrane protease YdiL (CAAX protease family)